MANRLWEPDDDTGYPVTCPQCNAVPPAWDCDYDDQTVADCPQCDIRFVLGADGRLLRSWSLADDEPTQPVIVTGEDLYGNIIRLEAEEAWSPGVSEDRDD